VQHQHLSIDICSRRPTSPANPLCAAATVHWWDRQTDGGTDTRPFYDAYRTLCEPRNKLIEHFEFWLVLSYSRAHGPYSTYDPVSGKKTYCSCYMKRLRVPWQLSTEMAALLWGLDLHRHRIGLVHVTGYRSNHPTGNCCYTSTIISLMKCSCQITRQKRYCNCICNATGCQCQDIEINDKNSCRGRHLEYLSGP